MVEVATAVRWVAVLLAMETICTSPTALRCERWFACAEGDGEAGSVIGDVEDRVPLRRCEVLEKNDLAVAQCGWEAETASRRKGTLPNLGL